MFVSPVFDRSVSDHSLTEQSGLLQLLEQDDSVMADKGFNIQELLASIEVRLNIPAMKQVDRQMIPQDVATTMKIAAIMNSC